MVPHAGPRARSSQAFAISPQMATMLRLAGATFGEPGSIVGSVPAA